MHNDKVKDECFKKAVDIAQQIASKSPVAIATIKSSANYSRDHDVKEGLNHIKLLNMSQLQTDDTKLAVMASFAKQKAEFPKL